MSTKRLFVFQDDKSNKFWEIVHDDADVTTRWGKVGTDGQSKTKTFDSASAAANEAAKLIREKTSKGYVESSESVTATESVKARQPSSASATGELKPAVQAKSTAKTSKSVKASAVAVSNAAAQASVSSVSDPPAIEFIEEIPQSAKTASQPSPNNRLPENIAIKKLAPGSIAPDAASEAWIAQLADRGAVLLSEFEAVQFPLWMQVFRDSKNRLIVISKFTDKTWCEIYVRDDAEIAWIYTNVTSTDGLTPPWSRMYVRPGADIATLFELADQMNIQSAEPKHTVKSFAETFCNSFQLSMMWRNSIAKCNTVRQPPSAQLERSVYQFAREYLRGGAFYADKGIKSTSSGAALLAADPPTAIDILISALRMQGCVSEMFGYDLLEGLCETLLKRQLPFKDVDIDALAVLMERLASEDERSLIGPFMKAMEHYVTQNALTETNVSLLRQIRKSLIEADYGKASTLSSRITSIIGEDKTRLPMRADEAWVKVVEKDLAEMPEKQRSTWSLLFNHCVAATSAKWDSAWQKQAESYLRDIGADAFHERIGQWLPTLNLPRLQLPNRHGWPPALSIDEAHQDIWRGLAWCCALNPTSDSPRILAALALSAFRKIPRIGSRAVRVGNACVMALNYIGNEECVGKLALLKIKVKNGTALRYIDSQLQKTADRLSVSRDELEEMSIPAYGMEEIGSRVEQLGDFTAQATVEGNRVKLVWLNANGKEQKSVPTSVTAEHADELKELKADIKDIEKMLAAQRERLENLYLRNATWNYETWRERYLDHPLVGILARRLIWEFARSDKRTLAIFKDGELRGLDNQPIALSADHSVRLWHPLNDSTELIANWRQYLIDQQICQPFKQAHREIYVLTPAEVETDLYSNRFAAHIVRQSLYRALAQSRLWSVNFLGAWDGGDEGTARRPIPAWGLRAEFTVLAAEEAEQYGEVTHVVTNQVQFFRGDDQGVLRMQSVPPLVFSEIMRDVDLFIGVGSIGNDPNWIDRGTEGHQGEEYWSRYAFGELSASAKTRYDVISRILPRLRIAKQCRLADPYLIVEGKLRTYKIHLGSSNIRMEPNDQYLCIVPERKTLSTDTTYLPFEGDSVLSIILSKALMLAQDDKIKDESILAQLKQV